MSAKRLLAITALISTFSPVISQATQWAPQVGLDYKLWGLEPNTTFQPLFPRINNGFNIYAGTRINGYFGFDAGYEQSSRRRGSQEFDGTEFFFADFENIGDAAAVTMRLHTIHFDINFYWEVARHLELIFHGGVAFEHIDGHIYHLTDGTWMEFQNETHAKTMGRIGLGLQYQVMTCLGLRALLSWEPGGRVNFVGYDQNNNWYSISPYKTATMFNIGFVYSLSDPRRDRVIDIVDEGYPP